MCAVIPILQAHFADTIMYTTYENHNHQGYHHSGSITNEFNHI
jgi:hypothetical protein